MSTSKTRATVSFGPYNTRRYSKPWIARVINWPIKCMPAIEWGHFLNGPGSSGECEIFAEPGDIIRWGQKDKKDNSHTVSCWGILQNNGRIQEVSPAEAKKQWIRHGKEKYIKSLQNQKNTPAHPEIIQNEMPAKKNLCSLLLP